MALPLARDVFVRDEVHPVAERCDHARVGERVEGDHLGQVDTLVEVMHRRVPRRAESTVDPPNELVRDAAELSVLSHVRSRRYTDL